MKIINFNNQQFEADKIIKANTDIIGKDKANNEVFAFRGITDFTQFILADGQEFDKDENKIKVETLEELQQENAELKKQIETTQQSMAEIMNLIAMQQQTP